MRTIQRSIAFILLPLFLFYGCKSYNDKEVDLPSDGNWNSASWFYNYNAPQLHQASSIVPVPNDFLCAPYTNPLAPERPCTLLDVINDKNPYDTYEPKVHVIFSIDDFISDIPNASMEQKGKSTREAEQTSFRVKLDSKTVLYDGERVLQLSKHPYDHSRLRNKLFFDLFSRLPYMMSLRTKFVHLYVDNQDNGLYTHTEKVDKYYLINRGLDEDGKIYKAQDFDFSTNEAYALDDNGEPINLDAFNQHLEIQNGKNHKGIVSIINAVNSDMSDEDFMQFFKDHFDLNNYATWMAMNIVTANRDTINQNFILFNPAHSDKFYFIPWDYDGASWDGIEYAKWQKGLYLWWSSPLHKKFLRIKEYRDAVAEKIQFIYSNYINPQTVAERIALYRPIVEPLVSAYPDSHYLSHDKWLADINMLPNKITQNIQDYQSELSAPTPYWQGVSYDKTLSLLWERSIDFAGNPIVYDIVISKSPDMSNPIYTKTNVSESELEIDSSGNITFNTNLQLSAGVYYLKIIAKELNNPANYQIAFDQYHITGGPYYFGVYTFTIGN